MKHYRWRRAGRLLAGLLVAVLVIWPLIEPHILFVDSHSVVSSDLPSDIRRLRVCFATDIHMSAFPYFSQQQTTSMIQEINRQNPDIILLGGDLTNRWEDTLAFFHLLRDQQLPRFRASYGVYAVLGEMEMPPDSASQVTLRRAAADAGITLIGGGVTTVRLGSSSIQLCGLDANATERDVTALAAQVASEDFVILVSHSPAVIDDALKATSSDGRLAWFDLGLFGHTHGGQYFFKRNTIYPDAYTPGWQTENRIPILISNGVGTTGLPLRYFCPPQIHVINITAN